MRDVLRTALCDLLGIEDPVIQPGVGSIAGPDLVAEVSRAGGLGSAGIARIGTPPPGHRPEAVHRWGGGGSGGRLE